jgi:hypothetical protein
MNHLSALHYSTWKTYACKASHSRWVSNILRSLLGLSLLLMPLFADLPKAARNSIAVYAQRFLHEYLDVLCLCVNVGGQAAHLSPEHVRTLGGIRKLYLRGAVEIPNP